MMHSKDTVSYICEDFAVTGTKLYWKKELLTTDTYKNPKSVYWSRRKPITRATFVKAERAGYPCETVRITRPPGCVLMFTNNNSNRPKRRRQTRGRKGRSSALVRFLSR